METSSIPAAIFIPNLLVIHTIHDPWVHISTHLNHMCFFSQGTPHQIDITHYPFWHHTYLTLLKTVLCQLYIISLCMHSQPLTSIPKSAADILNQYQFFSQIYHPPILYMVTLSPKCRDLDSELLSSNFRIRSHLDQALKTDIKVPPSNNSGWTHNNTIHVP